MISTVPVVYILGAGHSGSTLLAMLLGSHPEICTIGEVKWLGVGDPATYQCSCGQSLAECVFWTRLANELRACDPPVQLFGGPSDIRRPPSTYQRWLLRPLHRWQVIEGLCDLGLALSPSWHGHVRRVRAFTSAVSRGVCRVSNRRVFVDSSKAGQQFKCLLKNPELDVRAIRLVRDVRGVALKLPQSGRIADPRRCACVAAEQRRGVGGGRAVGRRPLVRLRYKDLCRDAATTLKLLFAFIGVDATHSITSLEPNAQHILGNDRMRLDVGQDPIGRSGGTS